MVLNGHSALPRGGTALFAMMALAGDLGCSGGPTLVGMVSSGFGDNLRAGILAALIFPVLLVAGIGICRRLVKNTNMIQEESVLRIDETPQAISKWERGDSHS